MKLQDGSTQTFVDNWNFPADRPVHRQNWTGETWFEMLPEDEAGNYKRGATTYEPMVRITKKTRFETAEPPEPMAEEDDGEPSPTPDGELPVLPPPGLGEPDAREHSDRLPAW